MSLKCTCINKGDFPICLLHCARIEWIELTEDKSFKSNKDPLDIFYEKKENLYSKMFGNFEILKNKAKGNTARQVGKIRKKNGEYL